MGRGPWAALLSGVALACVGGGRTPQTTHAGVTPETTHAADTTPAALDAGHAAPSGAATNGCSDDDEDCAMHPGVFVLSPTPTDDGTSCTATPEVRADGCEVWICETTRRGSFISSGDATQEMKCGEEAELCGRPYRCECQKCSGTPDYATRMQRGRVVGFKQDGRILLLNVKYEGGKCTAAGDTDYGGRGVFSLGAWDASKVGGCLRRTKEGHEFDCGESVNVCGVEVRGECADGGVRYFTVDGKTAVGSRMP
jgi:hypothetical protein